MVTCAERLSKKTGLEMVGGQDIEIKLWLGLPTVEKWVIGECLAKRIHPGIVIFGEVTHENVTAITCHFNSTPPGRVMPCYFNVRSFSFNSIRIIQN